MDTVLASLEFSLLSLGHFFLDYESTKNTGQERVLFYDCRCAKNEKVRTKVSRCRKRYRAPAVLPIIAIEIVIRERK